MCPPKDPQVLLLKSGLAALIMWPPACLPLGHITSHHSTACVCISAPPVAPVHPGHPFQLACWFCTTPPPLSSKRPSAVCRTLSVGTIRSGYIKEIRRDQASWKGQAPAHIIRNTWRSSLKRTKGRSPSIKLLYFIRTLLGKIPQIATLPPRKRHVVANKGWQYGCNDCSSNSSNPMTRNNQVTFVCLEASFEWKCSESSYMSAPWDFWYISLVSKDAREGADKTVCGVRAREEVSRNFYILDWRGSSWHSPKLNITGKLIFLSPSSWLWLNSWQHEMFAQVSGNTDYSDTMCRNNNDSVYLLILVDGKIIFMALFCCSAGYN